MKKTKLTGSFRFLLGFLVVFGLFYLSITVIFPAINQYLAKSSPIVSIHAENNSICNQTIDPKGFTVTAKHKNGRTSNVKDFTITPKKTAPAGKYTKVTVKLKDDPKIFCTTKVKNERKPLVRFRCGYPDLKNVKAVLYDNGELCFEGKGDVLQFETYPWQDYENDQPVQAVTFEEGVTPVVMDNWFSGMDTITYVGKIPASVESMSGTFNGCTALEKGADWNACTNLRNVNSLYQDCTSLTEIPPLPASVITANSMCEGCKELQQACDLTNAANLIYADSMFASCTKITNTSVAPKLLRMDNMYAECMNIKEMPIIPASVESMSGTFSGDISLSTLTAIPASVRVLDNCFNGCTLISGNCTIDASCESFESCFSNAAIATKVNLIGKSPVLSMIAATAENGNVLANGKVPPAEQ